jgi:hypothetical protein
MSQLSRVRGEGDTMVPKPDNRWRAVLQIEHTVPYCLRGARGTGGGGDFTGGRKSVHRNSTTFKFQTYEGLDKNDRYFSDSPLP